MEWRPNGGKPLTFGCNAMLGRTVCAFGFALVSKKAASVKVNLAALRLLLPVESAKLGSRLYFLP
jgi:hypothetical protein